MSLVTFNEWFGCYALPCVVWQNRPFNKTKDQTILAVKMHDNGIVLRIIYMTTCLRCKSSGCRLGIDANEMRYEFKQMTSVKYISMSCLLSVRCIFESIFVELLRSRWLCIMSGFSKAPFPVISTLFGACWCQILIKPEKVGHIITAGQIDIMSASKQTLWHFHLKKFHWT